MANWITSKLKAAENILQQIDKQAAESLGKNEKTASEEIKFDTPAKTCGVVSLKDQLKKKSQESGDYQGKLSSDPNANLSYGSSGNKSNSANVLNRDKGDLSTKAPSKPKSTKSKLTDSDWTELLSAPTNGTGYTGNSHSNGTSVIRGLKKDASKKGHSGLTLSMLEGKRNQKSNVNVIKSMSRSNNVLESKLNGKPSDGEQSSSSERPSTVDIHTDDQKLERLQLNQKDTDSSLMVRLKDDTNEKNDHKLASEDLLSNVERGPGLQSKKHSFRKLLDLGKVDGAPDVKIGTADAHDQFSSIVSVKSKSFGDSRSSVSSDVKRGSSHSSSGGSSGSNSDSGSMSDSESEGEREERRRRKERILAERAAAKAMEAIKERDNMVARLEGEKQSLEKILEERAKQQALEASELQTTMMEMMEAVDLEKQKHNNTRMEALQRLAKLETTNADLARSLATAQKKLEMEINQVADIRQQIELKEAAHEELKRRISNCHQSGTYLNQLASWKGLEHEILEEEISLVTDKIGRLQEKARLLEASIESTRKEMEHPTEVEFELKRRLGQLTDHLIQKQAQVESLSSEKATLSFRIETVSSMLDESKPMNTNDASSSDIEPGTWDISESKLKPLLEEKFRSGRRQLGSLLTQLDAIFVSGAVFLRRNATAKLWSLVYLVCLHIWVMYILMSHSKPTEGRSGAVMSLENINKTAGI